MATRKADNWEVVRSSKSRNTVSIVKSGSSLSLYVSLPNAGPLLDSTKADVLIDRDNLKIAIRPGENGRYSIRPNNSSVQVTVTTALKELGADRDTLPKRLAWEVKDGMFIVDLSGLEG